MSIKHIDLGKYSFEDSLQLQYSYMNAKKEGLSQDFLFTVEHPHIYTIGSSGSRNNLLVDKLFLTANSIGLKIVGRGGDITYHGPGQLVAYPLLDLNNYKKDLHWYLRKLEDVLIRTVSHFGINANRQASYTGIWVEGKKLASIGIKMSKWITMHGAALNVSTDLSYFQNIIPCGIRNISVTSMSELLGIETKIEIVMPYFITEFSKVFEQKKNIDSNGDSRFVNQKRPVDKSMRQVSLY